ncbi:MAG: hypothetical protein JO132_02950 [Streptosporangiaceae bacterium]|nr:hypothetical protein [Streptosporangiaceae bacterium]
MPASTGYLVIDTTAPERLAAFSCKLLDRRYHHRGQPVPCAIPLKRRPAIGFQRLPDAKTGTNRLHLDLIVDDLDRATTRPKPSAGTGLSPAPSAS